MMSNIQFSPDNPPLILAVDTSSAIASLAITQSEKLIASIESDALIPHSKIFFNLLSSLLQNAGLQLAEIAAFAAATGPGSFTGLRVGLSALKGLSHATGKPAVGIGSIDAVALTAKTNGKILAMIDAGREEVYAGLREVGADGTLQQLGADMAGGLANVLESFDQYAQGEKLIVIGPGNQKKVLRNLPPNWQLATAVSTTAEAVAICAAKVLHGQSSFDLHPRYIRPSDAEIKKSSLGAPLGTQA